MKRVQLGIWKLWWECPHCLHDNIVEIDEGEEPSMEAPVHCQICKCEYIAVFDPCLLRGIHDIDTSHAVSTDDE
jgi:transcription elongation factor Elf1